ncbi:MAG: hypothetical protein HQL20_04145 [Candidatus Omnitrophica bacterium]|nr:hypothetical protein [Candidatus Omnitrophota bacterium]
MPIAHVVFPVPVDNHFDYLIPGHLSGQVAVGCRVQVVFARKKCVGVVVGLAEHSGYKDLITIIKILDAVPVFSAAMLAFARNFAEHNACSFGEALFLALPAYLRKAGDRKKPAAGWPAATEVAKPEAVHRLIFDPLFEKRWEILLPIMRAELAAGRGVLVLVPESSYLEEVLPHLGPLAAVENRVLLRQDAGKDEYARWLRVRSGEVKLAVGFLSAVFAPVQSLGLIVIVDEESRFYKNDQTPFYHAREAAFLRAEQEKAAVVCISSAPSVELWRQVVAGGVAFEKAVEPLPGVRFLDISNFKMKKGSLLSPGLRLHLEKVLKEGGKALLYVPAAKGVGYVLEELAKYLPQARAAGYEQSSGARPLVDILVATQAVFRFRGRVTFDFAAALDIDYEFHKADHRAAHAAFALVQYLRQMARKSVLLQTRESRSPQLHAIADDSHEKFYAQELPAREETGLPPFGTLAALVIRSADPELACAEAKRLYDVILAALGEPADSAEDPGINVMEPQQDRSAILRGKFRWCVVMQGRGRAAVVKAARGAAFKFRGKKDTILTVNIDP